jgi:hypothetical protein
MSLEANNYLYELLLAEVARLDRQDDARLLPLVEKVANAAWYFHPGRFADGALENVPFRVGMRMAGPPTAPFARTAPDTAPAGSSSTRSRGKLEPQDESDQDPGDLNKR